jgi:hypothetical protein
MTFAASVKPSLDYIYPIQSKKKENHAKKHNRVF